MYEFRNVFSSSPTDMGRTGLVKPTIDTGDQRPIRLPPRLLPIAKQEIEQEEVQKMLDRGVIEFYLYHGPTAVTCWEQLPYTDLLRPQDIPSRATECIKT